MAKKHILLFSLLLALTFTAFCSPRSDAADTLGHRYFEDGIPVIDLHGSWHQMGRQYGILAKEYVDDVLAYLDVQLKGDSVRIAEAAGIADLLYSHYPQQYKEFFDGVCATSGLTLERVKLCNAVEFVEKTFFCSAMAAWGDYAKDKLVFGRNYDAVSFSEIGRDVVLTVYHPEGEMSAATIGYAGELYCVNGFNEKGIFVELNNGTPSAGRVSHWELCPSTTHLFTLLFRASTMDDVERFFARTQSFSGFIIGVSNKDEARAYEWCYDGVRRSDQETPEGLLVSTNHYVNPSWPFPTPSNENSWNSLIRRSNLLERAQEYKGVFDVEKMADVMSMPIEAGGPYHNLTRYQMVAVPADMTLYLHIVGTDGWTTIDLEKYFQ